MNHAPRLALFAFVLGCAGSKDTTDDTQVVDDSEDSEVLVDTEDSEVLVDSEVPDTDDSEVIDSEPVDTEDSEVPLDSEPVDTEDSEVADSDDTFVGLHVLVLGNGTRAWDDGTHASSCAGYLNASGGYTYAGDTGDGAYWIDPDGLGGAAAFVVTCDMTAWGGGWTLVGQATPVADAGQSLCNAAAVGSLSPGPDAVSAPAKLADAVIEQIWAGGAKEVRMTGELGVAVTAPASGWDTDCYLNFVDAQAFSSAVGASYALDTTTMYCAAGNRTVSAAYAEADTCGYGFQLSGGSYMIWSYDPDYALSCGNATAGRSWPGSSGNNGCNTSKTWVR
jgi:hypothetical protein